MWQWLEKYFTFTRAERGGILLLLFLSVCAFIIPALYLFFKPIEHNNNSVFQKEVDMFVQEFEEKKQAQFLADSLAKDSAALHQFTFNDSSFHFGKKEKKDIAYFNFDPNKIGVDEWMKLGFSEKQAAYIEKSKSSGWKFYKPEDLKEMFVVGEENYKRLSPYIKIEPILFPRKEYPKTVYPEKNYNVDINTADSSLFERMKGIGPSLASRIVKYRDRLGGFISGEQIKEIWNFPDSTYQSLKDKFVVSGTAIHQIDLNNADFETLRKHPYINYSFAKVILAYKKEHGNFKTADDLKKIVLINDSIYRKLQPYVLIR